MLLRGPGGGEQSSRQSRMAILPLRGDNPSYMYPPVGCAKWREDPPFALRADKRQQDQMIAPLPQRSKSPDAGTSSM